MTSSWRRFRRWLTRSEPREAHDLDALMGRMVSDQFTFPRFDVEPFKRDIDQALQRISRARAGWTTPGGIPVVESPYVDPDTVLYMNTDHFNGFYMVAPGTVPRWIQIWETKEEARRIVRDGLRDVIEWLEEAGVDWREWPA